MNDQTHITPASSSEPTPMVFARDGEVYTNSQHVAAHFGKLHKNVLRDIDELIVHGSDLSHAYFQEVSEAHPAVANRQIRSFDLTKDGFTLLVMGYTGPKAIPFKLAYIAKFNAMEAELRARPTPAINYADPQVLIGVMQHLQGQLSEKDAVIAAQGEQIKHMDRIEGSVGAMCLTDAAKTLKTGPQKLIQFMSTRSWIYKRVGNASWVGRQEKITAGYLEHKEHVYTDSLGQERVATRALVTGKGLLKLSELLDLPLH